MNIVMEYLYLLYVPKITTCIPKVPKTTKHLLSLYFIIYKNVSRLFWPELGTFGFYKFFQ